MGVWIEILVRIYCLLQPNVTPRVGVWIEIYYWPGAAHSACVTPRVGVWIEIRMKYPMQRSTYSHSPCGSVD